MGRKVIALFVFLWVVAASLPAQAQLITAVAHRNTDADAPEDPQIAPNPLAEDALVFVDRTHQYNDIPAFLLGAEYIILANDNKNQGTYELDVTVSQNCTIYVFVDNRMGGAAGGKGVAPVITGMPWLTTRGFVDTGEDIGVDESGDGDIDQYSSVFALAVKPGTVTIGGCTQGHGGNMLGVAVVAPRLKAHKPTPANGEQAVTLALFRWTAGTTAVFHNVYLGTSPDLTEADLVSGRLVTPLYYHGPGLTPGVTYYWRIDEVEVDMTTVHTGDVWSFTAASIAASNPSPADGAKWVDPNTELSWTAGKDAFSHEVYLSTDQAAVENADASALQTSLYLTTWKPPTLAADTTYYWRIDETTGGGTKTDGAVWSFTTIQAIEIVDPSLLAWWKMDEGVGATVVDWSGHGRHLTFASPAPTWGTGHFGGALEFAGNGDSAAGTNGSFLNGLDALTVAVWIKSGLTNTDKGFIDFMVPNGNDDRGMRYDAAGGTGGGTNLQKMGLTVAVDAATNTVLQLESSNGSQTTDWQHVTMVWSSGQALQFYINGKPDAPTANSTAVTGTLTGATSVVVGKGGKDTSGSWNGLVDEIRIYSKALTQEQIELIMRGDPLLAWDPSPANGATTDVVQAVPLTWQAGDEAVRHDVYLGTDQAAVSQADASDATGIYRGRQTGTSFTPATALEWGQMYFWRVDEINGAGSISRGFVWSFTLADHLIVDDFESYNDVEGTDTRIYETWFDGWTAATQNGATVGNWDPPFAEQTIVHGGRQSMPIDYNNVDAPFYSEVYRDFSPVQDWTIGGVDTLTLWVRGNPVAYQEDAGVITMSGSGHDIWDAADDFRFAHKPLSGNGSITVKVESVVNTNAWAKAGVMVRQGLDAESKFVYMIVSAAQGVSFGWRPLPAGACSSVTQAGVAAPQWVKLTRTGDVFTAQYSADGTTWLDVKNADGTVASTTVAMTGTPYIGLCVTSHNAAATTTAVFSGAVTTGGVTGQWRVTAIGDDPQLANSPGTLYVTVQDSSNKTATVTHPTAVTTGTWTPWPIPLSDLAGVNVSKIKRLYIGVGDKNSPEQDGFGRIYIDDIQVVMPAPAEPVSP